MRALFLILFFFASGAVFGQGVVSANLAGANVSYLTVTDSSCPSLKVSLSNTGRTLFACSVDPLNAGAVLLFSDTGSRTVQYGVVVAVTAPAAATAYPSSAQPLFQGSAVATSSQFAASPLTVKDAFGTATPEQYEAIALVFAAALSLLAFIWAGKRLVSLLSNIAEA